MDAACKASQNDTPLSLLQVLSVDCQGSITNPDKGQLLEIGLMAGSAARPIDANAARSHLIRQRQGMAVPAHVLKITGISESDLDLGITDSKAWQVLFEAARRMAPLTNFESATRCAAVGSDCSGVTNAALAT